MPRLGRVRVLLAGASSTARCGEEPTRLQRIAARLTDYVAAFVERGGFKNNGKEGVAILARRSRFVWEQETSKDFSPSERRKANGCPKQTISSKGTRNAVRVKLTDKRTNEVIDVFNTHFPSKVSCEKVGMTKLLRAYVRKFGDNVLLMGDFNTGVAKNGDESEGFAALTRDGYLLETYVETHNMTDGHSLRPTSRPTT